MLENSVNFDRAADYYDASRGFPEGVAPQVGAFIAENVPFTRESHLLEVGVGTGRIALPLAPHVGRITGFDISREMMDKLREKSVHEPIALAVADAHQMPFAPAAFDAVCITHVLHLVADAARVLAEIRRVVKPDGVFVHMRNQRGTVAAYQPVVDAWNAVVADAPRRTRQWDEIEDRIRTAHWQLVAEHIFIFPYVARLRDFVDNVENRRWSSTWLMDDAVWERGLAAVNAVIAEQFGGDRTVAGEAEGGFAVRVYRPS